MVRLTGPYILILIKCCNVYFFKPAGGAVFIILALKVLSYTLIKCMCFKWIHACVY